MKRLTIVLLLLTAGTLCHDSVAGPDAGAPKVVIPPWVEEAQLPPFDAEPFPVEASKAPAARDWKDAPPLRVSRVAHGVTGCRAHRIQEWIKLRCERQTAGVRLLAGSRDGVTIVLPEPDPSSGIGAPWFEIVLPVRRGDRRVFEVFEPEAGYEDWWPASSMVVEERWLEGAKSPTIALLGT